MIVEGYAEYATWRPHLAYLRDPYGDPDMEMEIDGVGGVSILAKAKVFRSGVHFPAFSFEKHAETEGFGKVRPNLLVYDELETDCSSDGETDGLLGGRFTPLYRVASLRTKRGRYQTHGGDGARAEEPRKGGKGAR